MRWTHSLVFALAFLVAGALGCETVSALDITGPPAEGSVTARVVSVFGIDDQQIGINLPRGIQVTVLDGTGQPVADAVVNVYPNGRNSQPLAHQGNGIYEFDVLSDRLDEVEDEYFFEVESELIYPERNVMRVPHEALDQRPTIVAPTERSEHPVRENLVVRWEAVPGADCYDLSVREHTLEGWAPYQECIRDTVGAIAGDDAHDFNYIRVRARRVLGNEALDEDDPETPAPDTGERYVSRSYSDAQVRIFFVTPED